MPTLAEIIDRHEAAQPAPIALTPLSVALVEVLRLERTLADLSRADRACVRRRLRDLIGDGDA